MRTVLCAGSVLLVLVSACGIEQEVLLVTVRPTPAPVHEVSIVWQSVESVSELEELPELVPPRRTRRRADNRLPAPGGLLALHYDPPLIITEPVVWDDHAEPDWMLAASMPDVVAGQPDFLDPAAGSPVRLELSAAVGRLDEQAQHLADLAIRHAEMSETLDALRAIIPTLPRVQRSRAGLQACALRRELEALAETQREVHRDVVAARNVLDPSVRVATR